MKFFLIVSFLMTSAAVERPMYVFKSPSFDTQQECKEYVSVMYMKIYQQASASYNYRYTPESIYCITEDAVKEIFEYNYGKQDTKKQKI
jgi:hypothetical protein